MALPLAQTGNTIVQLGAQKSPFSADSQDGYDEWGSVTINGRKFVCPTDGYFTVKGAARNYRWDVQNGLMLQGAIQFFRGVTPTEFTLECAFWAESQYAAFLEVVAGFQYNLKNILQGQTSGGPFGQLIVRAVTIYHPALDLVGINQVNIVAAGAPEKVSDDGMWHAEFKLREYSPPIQLPPQDKDTAPVQPNDPLAPELQNKATQVQNLTNQANSLTWINPTS